MKTHTHRNGRGRHFLHPALRDCVRGDSHHHHHGGGMRGAGRRGTGRGGRGGARLFDYGELRLVVLALLSERPAHGYELIKTIEERFGGSYSPSPGVIYPTLSWLEDMGYAVVEPQPGSRKSYSVTPEGQSFLDASRAEADALLARAPDDASGRGGVPAPMVRAMENFKMALRLRLRAGPIDGEAADTIAAALDEAARIVEKSQ
jgi:DNA-binding PadR family transcriptional regulator